MTKQNDKRKSDSRFEFNKVNLAKVERGFKSEGSAEKERYWYDAVSANLALRCRKGTSHYTDCDFYMYRKIKLQGETRGKLYKRKIISVADARAQKMRVEDVRDMADKLYMSIRDGDDPNLRAKREQAALHQAEAEAEARRTYREMIPHFVRQRGVGERYQRDLYRHLDQQLKPIADIPLCQLTQKDLIGLCEGLGRSAQLAIAFREVRSVWNWAESQHQEVFTHKNPVTQTCKTLKWDINHSNARSTIVQKKSLGKFFRAVLDLRNRDHTSSLRNGRDSLLLMAFTGMRVTAAVETPTEWIDLPNGTMKLRNKGGKVIEIPINRAVRAMIENRLLNLTRDRLKHYLFPGIGARRDDHYATVQAVLKSVRRDSGFHIQNHDLRRTFKSTGAKIGIHPLLLNDLVGHERDLTDVNRHYIHFEDEEKMDASNKIVDAMLDEAGFDVLTELRREW